MAYDQQTAFRNFDGLLKLFLQYADKVVDEDITTQERYRELHAEGKKIVEAYNEEVMRYLDLCKTEQSYLPTLEMVHELQHLVIHTGHLLVQSHQRIQDIERGKATFFNMMGPSPKTRLVN